MTRRAAFLAAALFAGGVPVAGAAVGAGAACGSEIKAPSLNFNKRVYIDQARPGGEPVAVVAQDGSISVSSHGGTTHLYKDPASVVAGARDFASTYTGQTLNWRSADNGKTWKYVGLAGQQAGPHTLASTGFSDPDYAIDAGGRIYNTEINLANVAVFSSNDDGQTYSRGNPEVTSGDRPWLAAGRKDEAYLYVNTLQQIFRTTDGGVTWLLQSRGNTAGPLAKFYIDPLNPDTLIGPNGTQGVAISKDQGKTWKAYPGAGLDKTADHFGALAVDAAGTVYRAAAGGYTGPSDKRMDDGVATVNSFDRKTMTWGQPITLPAPAGDMLWPWMVAGDAGKVAVTWLQRLKNDPNAFHVMVAATNNAHGTTVKCKNGKKARIAPRWKVVEASKGPIHRGAICESGTGCNASPSFPAGDRRLGDFFSIAYDKSGHLFIVTGDTTKLLNETTRPVSLPIFIGSSSGFKIVAKPMKTRPTRPSCLANPLC